MTNAADDLEPWKSLREAFWNSTDPAKACRLPTITDIEKCEADLGIRLPAGYRGFTQVFGPGVLTVGRGWIRLGAPHAPKKLYDLTKSVRQFRENFAQSSWMLTPQAFRLIRFASCDNEEFGWDPEDMTDPGAPEFGIYRHRHGEDNPIKLTRTFEGFIRLFTNQTEFRTRMRARVSDPDIADPTFGYFQKDDGTWIPGTGGQALQRVFEQLKA